MPEADDKSNATPNPWEGLFKLGQEVAGGVRKMFEGLSTSTNSSSPTPRDTESAPRNSNGFFPMPSATDAPAGTSSTSSVTESDSSGTSSGSDAASFSAIAGTQIAAEREVTVILHLTTYGTADQARQSVSSMLRGAAVRGANILAATYNGEDIPEVEYDPKRNPWKTVE